MENENNQPGNTGPVIVRPDNKEQTVPTPQPPDSSNPIVTPPPAYLQPAPEQPAPKKSLGNYLMAGLGVLIGMAILLPASAFAQMLGFPIVILGVVAGIKFFVDSIRSSKHSNPIVRTFFILGGLGVGVVIFFVCLIAGAIVGFAKDPNPHRSA